MTITKTTPTIDATNLFRAAYENRYNWDANFPGFTALVQSTQDGVTHQASVLISPDLKITLTEASSDEAEKLIYKQIQEIVIHRVQRSFDEVHGKNEFTLEGTDDHGAAIIRVSGAAMGDRYKVHNKVVTMVHRHIHNTVVTINVSSTMDTGKGYLPIDYESFYSNPSTDEPTSPTQHHHDQYERFGDYFLPTLRRVSRADQTDASQTQELRLSQISLL
jgi:hypothetical protein